MGDKVASSMQVQGRDWIPSLQGVPTKQQIMDRKHSANISSGVQVLPNWEGALKGCSARGSLFPCIP